MYPSTPTLTEEYIKIIEEGARSVMTEEQFIKIKIDEWMSSQERHWMLTGQRYYIGETDILNRKRTVIGDGGDPVEVKNLANNKLVHNFVRKLVDQKVGYLLGLPLTVQTNNKEYQELLNEIFDKQFMRTLKNIGKEAVNKGKAWLHVYYNEEGQLSFKKIPSEEIIPLWKDAAHTEIDAVIRVYEIEAFEGQQKTTITKVEFWNKEGVRRYELRDGELIPDVESGEFSGHFKMIVGEQEVDMTWERIPFVCFKYNDEEIPLIKYVKTLVDDYDKHVSDHSNNLEDLPNSIYVIRNYDGTDLGEFRRNLSIFRAVKVTDEGGVDTLDLKIDSEAYKVHIEQLRKDIYEFGRGVDTQTERFGGDRSGVALRFLYADLDMDCNIIETEFQAALEQLRWFIDQHIANIMGKDFSSETVEFIFSRDIIINEAEVIAMARNSVGILSDETIIANHPWVTNAKEEMERIRKQREEDLARFQGYSDLEQNGGDNGDQ